MQPESGSLAVERADPGGQAWIDLNNPPLRTGYFVVATFHTHPNPGAEGWDTGPSPGDEQSAMEYGVPCLIVADDGIHTAGPKARRGGLSGEPGFPHQINEDS
jgi:hypothetical protein